VGRDFKRGRARGGRWSGDARCERVHGWAYKREVRGKEGANKLGPWVSGRGRVGEWGGTDRRDPLTEGDGGNERE
jgi:hypothetical protein